NPNPIWALTHSISGFRAAYVPTCRQPLTHGPFPLYQAATPKRHALLPLFHINARLPGCGMVNKPTRSLQQERGASAQCHTGMESHRLASLLVSAETHHFAAF